MLNYLIKHFLKKHIKPINVTAEEILYEDEVYLIYLKTRANFNNAMHQRQLTRENILQIKSMLNKALKTHIKSYNRFKFKNDAHEIYTKLKSKHLSKKALTKIDRYIAQCIESNTQCNALVKTVNQS